MGWMLDSTMVFVVDNYCIGGKMKTIKHRLTIKPAVSARDRYQIEDAIRKLNMRVTQSGLTLDWSECVVLFEREVPERRKL